MNKIEEFLNKIKEIFWELVSGFSLSGIGVMILPELTHMIFVLITGFLGTIVIHFTKKFLNDDK